MVQVMQNQICIYIYYMYKEEYDIVNVIYINYNKSVEMSKIILCVTVVLNIFWQFIATLLN